MDIKSTMAIHYLEALKRYDPSQIAFLCLQGSQNYELDYENSDVDTKCIILPNFKEICLNRKPVSTTHILDNNEHIDAKDVRLYLQTFRKQNVNFVEILFTKYSVINPFYNSYWEELIEHNEEIARLNPYRAIKSMKGVACEKYHAMEHCYPSKVDIIEKFGYDGKQVSHLLRIQDFIKRYADGEDYAKCLVPLPEHRDRIMSYKKQEIPLEVARKEAKVVLDDITSFADAFCAKTADKENDETIDFLEDFGYRIMKEKIKLELI